MATWTYYFWLAIALELAMLAIIVRTAWAWPRTAEAPRTVASGVPSMPR